MGFGIVGKKAVLFTSLGIIGLSGLIVSCSSPAVQTTPPPATQATSSGTTSGTTSATSPTTSSTGTTSTGTTSTGTTSTTSGATGSTATANWGVVAIQVTDPPPADVTSAVVHLTNLQVHMVTGNSTDNSGATGNTSATAASGATDNTTTADNSSSSDNSGWVTIIDSPVSFDLMNVVGVQQLLGSANISAGSFTQIRMDVTSVTGVTTDNVSYTAEVPSSELKIVGSFDVGGGNKTVLTLDFDGQNSLIKTGQGFIFKPVVKLQVSHASLSNNTSASNGSSNAPMIPATPTESGQGNAPTTTTAPGQGNMPTNPAAGSGQASDNTTGGGPNNR